MRYTLISRSVETFDAYLSGPLGDYFYAEKHRDELAKRLLDMRRASQASIRAAYILLAIVIFCHADNYIFLKGKYNVQNAGSYTFQNADNSKLPKG